MFPDTLRSEETCLLTERVRHYAGTGDLEARLLDVRVMLDLDDVFFPWLDTVHEKCRIRGLHDGRAPWRTWHMWEDYGCSKEAWLDVVDGATADGMYHETPPYEGSVEQARRLLWEGAEIHVVTARGFMAYADKIREWTDEWLAEFALPFHTRTFAKDKVAAMSTIFQHDDLRQIGLPEEVVQTFKFDYALDDGVHNYEALDSAGVAVYLLNRPHNQDFNAERRVTTVKEFVDIIIKERAA